MNEIWIVLGYGDSDDRGCVPGAIFGAYPSEALAREASDKLAASPVFQLDYEPVIERLSVLDDATLYETGVEV